MMMKTLKRLTLRAGSSLMFVIVLSRCGAGVGPNLPVFPIRGSMNIIAGNADSGLNGTAGNAVFLSRGHELGTGYSVNGTAIQADPGLFVVTSEGTVYFRDRARGIMVVSATDNIQRLLIPTTGHRSGDDGPVSKATLVDPIKINLRL